MRRIVPALLLMSCASLPVFSQMSLTPKPKLTDQAAAMAKANFGRLPLSFVANQGQTADAVKFVSRGPAATVFLTSDEAVFSLTKAGKDTDKTKGAAHAATTDTVRMQYAGMRPDAVVTGVDRLPGDANYLTGSNEKDWHTSVPSYARVKYTGIYQNIDLLFYGNQQQAEYDFVVQPNGNPDQIRLHFADARHLAVNAAGDLVITAEHGDVAFHKPVVYQQGKAGRDNVSGAFKLLADNTVGFTLGAYDSKRPLVIDPVLVWSTYLAYAYGYGVAVDPAGGVYLAGYVARTYPPFPVTKGAFQTTLPANPNDQVARVIYVSKLNAAGTALAYSTFVAGTNPDSGRLQNINLSVDAKGHALLTSTTADSTYPTTANAFNKNSAGAFITELNASGSGLIYSTFLGTTTGQTTADGVAADAAGNIYIAGQTSATDLPIQNGFQAKLADANLPAGAGGDLYLAKFNPNASGKASLLYSTYLGGSGQEFDFYPLAVDANGAAYLTGGTASVDFPVTPTAYQRQCGRDGQCNYNNISGHAGGVAFLTKIDTTKSGEASLAYSTYLSGSGNASGKSVATDSKGDAYVTGPTATADFPTTNGVLSACHANPASYPRTSGDVFVAKIDTGKSGTASLAYSTCLGDTAGGVQAYGIAVDSAGSAYVYGALDSAQTNYPSVSPIQTGTNAFLSKLTADASAFVWSTRFGSDPVTPVGFALGGPSNDVYVTYISSDPETPTTAGSYNPNCSDYTCSQNSSNDVTVARISQADGAFATIDPINANFFDTSWITWPFRRSSSCAT